MPGPIAQLVVNLIADLGVTSLVPSGPLAFMEIDHEIISTVILLLPLIQEGLLSVTSEIMCTEYWLRWEPSGRVLDPRPRGSGVVPHQCHCVVVLEQDTFILA